MNRRDDHGASERSYPRAAKEMALERPIGGTTRMKAIGIVALGISLLACSGISVMTGAGAYAPSGSRISSNERDNEALPLAPFGGAAVVVGSILFVLSRPDS